MRKVFGILALCTAFGVSALSLSGCGFAPLYAKTGLTANMSQIELNVPQTRTGYFLEQDLHNGLEINDSAPKTYKLIVTMKERHYSVGYQVDDTSTRSEITSNISYVLQDIATKTTLYRNDFTETVTYDTSRSPFTGVIAQQDGQKRIATAISEQIQRDLALYFHGGLLPNTTAPAAPTDTTDTVKETEITPAQQ